MANVWDPRLAQETKAIVESFGGLAKNAIISEDEELMCVLGFGLAQAHIFLQTFTYPILLLSVSPVLMRG